MFVFLWHNNIGFNHLNSGTYFITKLCMIRRKIIRFIGKGLSLYTGSVFMVFNATFSSISVISWRSVLLEETGVKNVSGENHRAVASHWQFYHIMLYTSPWLGFELTTSVVIGTDCIGSYHHVITATTAPYIPVINHFLKINDLHVHT